MIVITTPTGQISRQLVARLLDMSQQIGGGLGVAILATIADSHTQTLLHRAILGRDHRTLKAYLEELAASPSIPMTGASR